MNFRLRFWKAFMQTQLLIITGIVAKDVNDLYEDE